MAERSAQPVFQVPARLSLTDIAYDVLLKAIMNQDFQPGAPLSIDHLARQLNMSNTPVREALMRAHGQHLVTQKANHGFIVTPTLTPDELAQLFEARHLLEMHALHEGTLTQETAQTIEQLAEAMAQSGDGSTYDDFRDYMTLDRQFHHALMSLSSNRFLVNAWEDLHVHLHLSRLYSGVGLVDRRESMREHRAIVEALRAGDRTSATEHLSQHIRQVEKRAHSFLEKD